MFFLMQLDETNFYSQNLHLQVCKKPLHVCRSFFRKAVPYRQVLVVPRTIMVMMAVPLYQCSEVPITYLKQ